MRKMNILLVDDREENLLALESLLISPSVQFYSATSGRQALEFLLEQEFAIAILDVHMPEMDGFELAELMRGTEKTRSVPIIFVTAGANDRLSTFKGYEKGAVDFLYKPLDPYIVKGKVQVFLDLAQQKELVREQLTRTEHALLERDEALLAAREALQTRDEFMSIASHELKTPLTSLHIQLQLLLRRIPPAVQMDEEEVFLEKLQSGLLLCERQSLKLGSLLEQLLDLTRVRLGRLELQKQPTDLVEICRDVVGRFKNETLKMGFEINVESPRKLVGFWDPLRIEQIMTNLCSNAIKYGESKPFRIVLTADKAKDEARIAVYDQGLGIPPDMQQKIFQRFERAVSSQQISGLGLGLYITNQIIVAHGGSIAVHSAVGIGSTFEITLPITGRREPSANPPASQYPSEEHFYDSEEGSL